MEWLANGNLRNYYQRIVDQLRQDAADLPIIAKYEKYLQHTTDRINST